ncbi:MAG: hypothetical protein U5L09_05725 [Bacteroidales bacterium]|nr:hypothetical protein [Bacteroidales bacterium]
MNKNGQPYSGINTFTNHQIQRNMKKLKILFLAVAIIASYSINAQVAVTTDGSSADGSAMLDVKSTDKGFLPPRMTTAERDAISNPAEGLMIYNNTLNDGQINVGTPLVPNWIGIKEQAMIDAVTEGGSVSTTSTSNVLVPGMTISPHTGNYLVLFNAQLSSSETFSSDQGVIDAANLYDELMAYPVEPLTH